MDGHALLVCNTMTFPETSRRVHAGLEGSMPCRKTASALRTSGWPWSGDGRTSGERPSGSMASAPSARQISQRCAFFTEMCVYVCVYILLYVCMYIYIYISLIYKNNQTTSIAAPTFAPVLGHEQLAETLELG